MGSIRLLLSVGFVSSSENKIKFGLFFFKKALFYKAMLTSTDDTPVVCCIQPLMTQLGTSFSSSLPRTMAISSALS